MAHHRGLRYGHGGNVRQSGVWADATAHSQVRSAGHLILCEYVGDQECITWPQLGLQSTGKTNAEHSSKRIMLP
jgi:hypothetical protein